MKSLSMAPTGWPLVVSTNSKRSWTYVKSLRQLIGSLATNARREQIDGAKIARIARCDRATLPLDAIASRLPRPVLALVDNPEINLAACVHADILNVKIARRGRRRLTFSAQRSIIIASAAEAAEVGAAQSRSSKLICVKLSGGWQSGYVSEAVAVDRRR